MSSTKFVFFQIDLKKQDGCPGLWLAKTFSTSLKPLKRIQRNWTGSKVSTSSTNFGFFSGQSEKQDGRPGSDWLRHFGLLLWNHWMEFYETLQEARSQCPLPSLCFFTDLKKQDGRPWPILRKSGTFYSGARYVALWAPCLAYVKLASHCFEIHPLAILPYVYSKICINFCVGQKCEIKWPFLDRLRTSPRYM